MHIRNTLSKSLMLLLFSAVLAGSYGGCSGNNNDRTTAVLDAMETIGVPGSIDMDGSGSFTKPGRELVSQTYTVFDMETGEIVFGPEVLTQFLDQAFIRTYILPEDAPENADGVITVSGDFLVMLEVEDSEGITDTADRIVSLDAVVLLGSSESCNATCSSSSNGTQVACTLNKGCFSINIEDNVLDPAATVESSIDDGTTIWIRACGAGGGKGTKQTGPPGKEGYGGFAQTITTVSGYMSTFGTQDINYYLGKAGDSNDSGGSGGASTIIASVEPQEATPWTLDELVVLAGGGGGGGEGNTGTDGGAGGFAYSDTVGEADTGVGVSVGGNQGGFGGGGTSCDHEIACGGSSQGGDSGQGGKQGFGGESGGSGSISDIELSEAVLRGANPKGWINSTLNIGDDGAGGKGVTDSQCDGGGGGGGFGGGGGGGSDAKGGTGKCGGGGGGGSYASGSTVTDGDAPDSNICGKDNGLVVITFNLDPDS